MKKNEPMKEDFLHYLWQYQLFDTADLQSTSGEKIKIYKPGRLNRNAGPDFLEAKLQIGDQLWVGNVEIHLNSSDWYVHNHEQDTAYDTVILHVVWQEGMPVFRKNNTPVSTLVLAGLVPKYIQDNYQKLFNTQKKWIACEDSLPVVDSWVQAHWIERLYVERLHHKSTYIESLLAQTQNDWEAVLFRLLLKNFGLKVNGENFANLSQTIDFKVFRKEITNSVRLEALLLGQAGLLSGTYEDAYFGQLKEIYQFQKNKYQLESTVRVQFFRLRPPNFPTIRLAQLAALYAGKQHFFQSLMQEDNIDALRVLLHAQAGEYWNTHYVFGKESKKSIKRTTKSLIDLVLINTIIPLKFAYQKSMGNYEPESLFSIMQAIKAEQNSIVKNFEKHNIKVSNAMESQALLTLKSDYCNKQACLQCEIGMKILKHTAG